MKGNEFILCFKICAVNTRKEHGAWTAKTIVAPGGGIIILNTMNVKLNGQVNCNINIPQIEGAIAKVTIAYVKHFNLTRFK